MEKYLELFKEMDGRFNMVVELRLGKGLQDKDHGEAMAKLLIAYLVFFGLSIRRNTSACIAPNDVSLHYVYGGVTFVHVSVGYEAVATAFLLAVKSFVDVVGEEYKTHQTSNGDLAITFTLP